MSDRIVFDTPRAAEFLTARALQSQTGRVVNEFGDVVLKELLDNALDAAESAGIAPCIEVTVEAGGGLVHVTVVDNGPGLPAEVVARILDFNVLVSDKAAYRSPTRGAQGNALKTLLGMPYALGVTAPVVIDACGVRHEIAPSIDPGGNVVIAHNRAESSRTSGTAITIPLPVRIPVDERRWLQGFAALNPHVTFTLHGNSGSGEVAEIYKATAPDGWRKPLPTDKTSAHWYDPAAMRQLVFAHMGAARLGGRDLPLGEFVRTFDGLSSTGKAKTVASALPGIRTLASFEQQPAEVDTLLSAMQAESRPPNAARLGRVGEDSYRTAVEATHGVGRFWYRHRAVDADGRPWVLEAAVAETTEPIPGTVVYGVNYSVTFADPLAHTALRTADVAATGAASFLEASDAFPAAGNGWRRAAVVHILTPAPEYTDKGKTHLHVPDEVAEVFAATLAAVTKDLRADAKRRERDARAQANREAQRTRPARETTLKEGVFEVIAAAADAARGGPAGAPGTLPFSTRTLLYKLRPLLQQITTRELKYDYFSQNLVPEYQRRHGPIPDLYYEPRGELHEPHDGEVVVLGTREVSAYQPTPWTYRRVLYVEKAGLWPVLEAARLAERYDLGVVIGQGYAAEAARALLANISGDVTIFVLHDADPHGYNIARTLGEETARMPDHQIDVIDLGLTVADAVELGLSTEMFTRKKALPARLDLTETEAGWFNGLVAGYNPRGEPNQWTCRRVELNAFSGPDLIAYIEAGLAQHGATEKVVPPQQVLNDRASAALTAHVGVQVERALAAVIDLDAITAAVLADMHAVVEVSVEPAVVGATLGRDRALSWRKAVDAEIAKRVRDAGLDIRGRVEHLLSDRPPPP